MVVRFAGWCAAKVALSRVGPRGQPKELTEGASQAAETADTKILEKQRRTK